VTIGLWILSTLAAVAFVMEGVPWLWPRLFPVPQEELVVDAGIGNAVSESTLSPERTMEVLRRTLAGLGATGDEPGTDIYLPRGKSPRDLELELEGRPALEGTQVSVTRVEDLLHCVRIYDGSRLLLQEYVRPYLPERPVVSSADPPELGLVIIFRTESDAAVREVGRWRAPVAIAVPAAEPHTVRTARQAVWSSKGVVVVVDPLESLHEQTGAAEDAGGVLLEEPLPEGMDPSEWLEPLAREGLYLIDGSGTEGQALEQAAAELGVQYLRRSAHLVIGSPTEAILARNLTVRRGHGIVTIDGTPSGIKTLSEFIAEAREDGYSLRFPNEVAQQHGAVLAGGVSAP